MRPASAGESPCETAFGREPVPAVERLTDLFPGTTHVALEGLLQAPDAQIWEHAAAGGFA